MDDLLRYNRDAWNRRVAQGNEWTVPVSPAVIAAARQGDWRIVLTPVKPVPADWFPPLQGCRVLCLAGAGGQQAPVLAAAGARVTVFDLSPAQLGQDRLVAERERLEIETIEGDMRDLSAIADGRFDLVVHPCSNCFVPDVRPVWREAYRVLRPGGTLIAGFVNPAAFLFDEDHAGDEPPLVKYRLPYSDQDSIDDAARARLVERGEPFAFSHSLQTQIGGQLEAGFRLAGLYEDAWPDVAISRYMPTFIATRAVR